MKKRKGQWFIVTALIMVSMMSAVTLAASRGAVGEEVITLTKITYDNIRTEFPRLVNTALLENSSSAHLENRLLDYSSRLENYTISRNLNMSGYLLAGVPVDDDMNITILNFDDQEIKDVDIILNGEQESIALIPPNSVSSITIMNVPDYFVFEYSLNFDGVDEGKAFNITKRTFCITKLSLSSRRETLQSIRIN